MIHLCELVKATHRQMKAFTGALLCPEPLVRTDCKRHKNRTGKLLDLPATRAYTGEMFSKRLKVGSKRVLKYKQLN